ncbi:Uncharacterised protein [Mycobacteroides abscessus]|nr:Uncharacterised protein [Mycobacteroides abscessus]
MNEMTGPSRVTCSASARNPCSNTSVTTPNAAPTENR